MNIILYFLFQLLSYGAWWLAFFGLIYCTARYTSWFCIPVAFLFVAIFVYYLDFTCVQSEMRKPDWKGVPDLDMIFMFGLLIRIALVDCVLVPFAVVGVILRRQNKRKVYTPNSA